MWYDRYCSGTSASCNGDLVSRGSYEVYEYCASNRRCNDDIGGCVSCSCPSNWCQDNNHGSGSWCSNDSTITSCGTNGSCYVVTGTQTCDTETTCLSGQCQNDCEDSCQNRCGDVGDCDCGDCQEGWACDPDGYCLDCSSGDFGFRTCDDFVHQREGQQYRQNTPVDTSATCANPTAGGWHDGPTVNNLNIRWTWTTGCEIPDASDLTDYSGDNARWDFSVPVEGFYKIQVKIPAEGYLCDYGASYRHADDVYYGLIREGASDRLYGPFAASQYKNQWMDLSSGVIWLKPGDHTLILYDHGSTGVDCLDGTGPRWVFVDSVRVIWDH